MKPTIAIAGASGFVGRWFIDRFHKEFNIIAFSRKKVEGSVREGVEWRIVDMYSLSSTTQALRDADYALYLVHSMQPSTRLNQSNFEDTDLLLADNFARAAKENDLKQIIYMGGIIPKDGTELSKHLRSRFEVEQTLGNTGIPVTTLRAGIIIGPGGSSFQIVEKLVNRLPAMACPAWTKSNSQPIDVRDVMHILQYVMGNEQSFGRSIEIGGDEVISYMDMLRLTARTKRKNRLIFSVPFFTLGLSKLWVGLFSDTHPTFVSPLIESLRHEMVVDTSTHQGLSLPAIQHGIQDSVNNALSNKHSIPKLPRREQRAKEKNTVRSVQRLPNPARLSARWVAKLYQTWLPTLFRYLIRVDVTNNISSFRVFGTELLKLEYIEDRSDEDRQLFYIVGGKLAKRLDYGWLEFRNVLSREFTIGAIHEFVPRLPWYLYIFTQAQIHLWVMKRFGKYLSTQNQ